MRCTPHVLQHARLPFSFCARGRRVGAQFFAPGQDGHHPGNGLAHGHGYARCAGCPVHGCKLPAFMVPLEVLQRCPLSWGCLPVCVRPVAPAPAVPLPVAPTPAEIELPLPLPAPLADSASSGAAPPLRPATRSTASSDAETLRMGEEELGGPSIFHVHWNPCVSCRLCPT